MGELDGSVVDMKKRSSTLPPTGNDVTSFLQKSSQ